MKEPAFDSTPEFQNFKKIMRGVLVVPKARLDELVQAAKQGPPRKNRTGKRRRVPRACEIAFPVDRELLCLPPEYRERFL